MKNRINTFFCLAITKGLFILFLLANVASAQTTIDCTNPSITYDMIAANAKAGGNPTNWGTFGTTPFAWESASSPSLNANATGVHATVSSNRTNVFYGSNSTTPADLISNQIFNLYRGPITLTGIFLNLNATTAYDESYISLIPSTYTNRNPVGRAGAGGNTPIGISVGGVIGSDLVVYDNLGNGTASNTIHTYTGVMPAINTWYTLSATFDIQGGNIVITDIRINGTTIAGFSSPLIVASSYYSANSHQWVNSVRAVASVDDLLDNFTITTNSCYTISGTVYNDANGLGDATVNGVPINNPGGSTLTAVLVDENEVIVDKTAIGALGTYSFSNVPGGLFEVRLTNRTVGAVGTAAPASSLPDGWINTGENIGILSGDDGSPNGSIVVGTSGATNVNFGIQTQSSSSNTFDCSTNEITFDMVSSNAKISNQSNQSATGTANPTNWGTVTNKFEWESFATDANIYGKSSAIPQHTDLSGANDASNVFFGGVWQNSSSNNTAAVTSDFISNQTFSLNASSGPVTLIGRFLDKSSAIEENESYLLIMPDNYSNFGPMGRYDPPGFGTKNERQGVYVGGNITTGLYIVDNHDAATASTIPASRSAGWDGLAPAPNTWYTMSVTFDVQGGNLVVTDLSINGTSAAFTYPVIVGTVASHSWLSSFRVGASADDLMDDFTITTNPCVSGNVYYDISGDGTVDGTPISSIGGNQLYVVLVDGSGNIVNSASVSGGAYSFSNVYPGTYTIRLTTTVPGAKGTPAPAATLAPTTWVYTGEHIGAGPGYDGPKDGVISVSPVAGNRLTGSNPILTGSTSVTYVNFGVGDKLLPVKLVDFSATLQGTSVQIKWVTATEIDNKYFVVEKSNNGTNWQQLHIIPTQGNGINLQYYTDVDDNPFPDKNFYRLKQVDIDAKFSYSGVVLVKMPKKEINNSLMVSPNPIIGGTATISFSSDASAGASRLIVCDANGRLLKSYSWLLLKGNNKINITDLNNLSNGTYYMFVTDSNGKNIGHTIFVK